MPNWLFAGLWKQFHVVLLTSLLCCFAISLQKEACSTESIIGVFMWHRGFNKSFSGRVGDQRDTGWTDEDFPCFPTCFQQFRLAEAICIGIAPRSLLWPNPLERMQLCLQGLQSSHLHGNHHVQTEERAAFHRRHWQLAWRCWKSEGFQGCSHCRKRQRRGCGEPHSWSCSTHRHCKEQLQLPMGTSIGNVKFILVPANWRCYASQEEPFPYISPCCLA